MEEQLIQSQKLEAIGTLASGIAHDFNNILSAIFGNLDLAIMDLPENIPARRNIENIVKAANRAKDLVGQILSFSRKGDKAQGTARKIHPHLIIREALILLRASLPSTIEIKEMIADKTGSIHADPTQFHQIIMNLCTNAHHAMKYNGGVLTIGLDKVKSAQSPYGDTETCCLKLTVSDTGCGMDDATLKRIFDPYFTTKAKDLGTGLGLSVVRKIVDDCKGQIAVFSHPGHGTRFEIFFPEAGSLETEQHLPAPEIGKGSGNILFVDDEADIANLGVNLLQRLGYSVVSSTLPLDALELVRKEPFAFDMVITDMTMPKMTGTRLAEAVKAIRPDMPVILCTGFSRSEIPEDEHARSVDAIMKKPVNLRDFSQTIERLLGIKNSPEPNSGDPAQGPGSFFL
jgi:CheY-like chemotaxis protein/anti-sigma regulatory factor (Ser/Thr protein kinase)